MNKIYDVAVIGAGIVGLSTALKLQEKGKKVLVLDKEKSPGTHQSGRNSGVIHSGIYYKPQSFKSNLCIRGRELLIDLMNKEKLLTLIHSPYISEKASSLGSMNQVVFKVDIAASKLEIKKAVEDLFDVKVDNVTT